MTAVIPVQQYGNIQPSIEIDVRPGELEQANQYALDYISDLFSKYSEKGGLTAKEIVVSKFTKKSFNEEGIEIEFEPVAHTYYYQGKLLQGATDYIKKFFKPFDEETISSVLETNWGVPQSVIKELWKTNGTLTSDFGNVVHKLLEYYEKFKDYGEVISSKKQEEKNYCLPKHPILREIVEGFLALPAKQGKVITEALVSDVNGGICGHADRILIIDEAKKICRVQDYKVNIDSEGIDKKYKASAPFNELPSNKITKYQLQMSIYANMLEKSGWSVTGLDVFVYEDSWKHFELPVLKVI